MATLLCLVDKHLHVGHVHSKNVCSHNKMKHACGFSMHILVCYHEYVCDHTRCVCGSIVTMRGYAVPFTPLLYCDIFQAMAVLARLERVLPVSCSVAGGFARLMHGKC